MSATETLGKTIKRLRLGNGMTQKQLATRLGLRGYTTISKLEHDDLRVSEMAIRKLAAELNVEEEYLLEIGGYFDVNKLREMAGVDIGLTRHLRSITNG